MKNKIQSYIWQYYPRRKLGYLKLKDEKVNHTVVLVEGKLIADKNKKGEIIGIEYIGQSPPPHMNQPNKRIEKIVYDSTTRPDDKLMADTINEIAEVVNSLVAHHNSGEEKNVEGMVDNPYLLWGNRVPVPPPPEEWREEFTDKFFVYKIGGKFPDHVGGEKEAIKFIENLLAFKQAQLRKDIEKMLDRSSSDYGYVGDEPFDAAIYNVLELIDKK